MKVTRSLMSVEVSRSCGMGHLFFDRTRFSRADHAVACSALTKKRLAASASRVGLKRNGRRFAFRVDGPVEVHPSFSDFDVGLVDFPGVGRGFEVRPAAFFQLWGILLDESDRSWYDRAACPRSAIISSRSR
jgi:hypothetical protein